MVFFIYFFKLRVNQYVLGVVEGSVNFSQIGEYYFCLEVTVER